jgi:DNA invertase Pin-like site-specific DNA recombinase
MESNVVNGRNVGYIRVSTADQNMDRPLNGITLDTDSIDRVSGTRH